MRDRTISTNAIHPVRFIVNPVSGRGQVRALVPRILRRLDAAGVAHAVYCTRGPGDAGRIAAALRGVPLRALVVAGGDGTLHDVFNALGTDGPPILVVPGGTENILAKYLRTRADAPWLTDVLLGGRAVVFDAARVNGRGFLLVAGMGFDAEVVRRVAEARRGHIDYASYFWPLWRTFWTYRHPVLRVEADGRLIAEGRGLALIGLVPRYAMGLRVFARARPDDGLLDACFFQCGGPGRLLRHAARTALRRHVGTPGVAYVQARRVRVTCVGATPLELDGEWAGTMQAGMTAEFEVVPRAARFLVSLDWTP